MALLQSLEIAGIRNFKPEERHTIYFSTPVVLFQGANGSGKTTILECIRYALTGELPAGTSNGQGFLNDPKMSNKTSVKASIKIKFSDIQGNILTVSRVLEVQASPSGALKFKRLNVTVRRKDKADPTRNHDVTGRCIDVDSYCCSALNVSKSILNNVLFCHQENSLWPLDEPKKLKDKFDEIFDAVRYNKCIEAIRKVIKSKQTFSAALDEMLKSKRIIKDHVENQRAKLEETKGRFKEVQKGVELKTGEMKPLKDRMKEIIDLEETLGSWQRKLTGKEEEKKGLANQQATLRIAITSIFEGTDEDLQEKIDSFRDKQASEETSVRKLEQHVQETAKQIGSVNLNIQTKQIQIGQMKGDQNQHNQKLQECQKLIEELRSELDVEDFGDKEILLGELSNVLRSQHRKFQDLKNEKDAEEKKLQSQIDRIREQTAGTKQSISSKKTAIDDSNNKLKEIRHTLEELDTSDTQLKLVNERIKNFQSTLTKLKESFNETEKKQEIEELKETITNKEQYYEKLEREYRVLHRNYATEQKIDSEKSRIIESQRMINKIRNKHEQNLKALFNEGVPDKNLGKSLKDIERRQEVELGDRRKTVHGLEKQLTTLETTLNHQRRQLKADQQELSSNKKKVTELCRGRSFATVLEETYKKKESLQKRKGNVNAAKIMYATFISKFEKNKACPVCETDFTKDSSKITTIVQQLKGKIHSIPSELVDFEEQLKKEETYYNELQQMKTVNDDIEDMTKNTIPELEEEIKNLEEEIEEKSMELAAERANLETPENLIGICKDLIADATLLDQYQTDITRAKMTVEDLEQSIETVPSKRSRQETEMEMDSVKAEISNQKNRYETNKNMLEQHTERCQDLNRKLQAEVQKQIDIQKLVQEKPLLEKQNQECSENIRKLEREIEELKTILNDQENELRTATDNKNSTTANNRDTLDKFQRTIIANQNSLSNIHQLEKAIQAYKRNNSEAKLEKAIEELAELNINLQKLEKTRSENLALISQKKESIAKKESEFRALKDNVTLREKQRLEEQVTKEIQQIANKIGGFNYRQVFEEKQKKSREIDMKQSEINRLEGQLEGIQKQLQDLEVELDKPDNRNAFNNFKKQHYKVVVNKLAINDLTRYVNVLELSVLKFHEERMVQINKSIRNLWRTIYRGNDIDYIEIKTDAHKVGAVNKRRTYNYRVVQVKNSIELDMRGRCSAGQKVLACLVIRMALAETFSAHCGILALDEPTTNLDKENIASLSDALSGLVGSRNPEFPFQLVVITHDEEFLRSLTHSQSIESYWQVKRNPAGNSTIEKKIL